MAETPKDGRRKAGIDADGAEAIALSRPLERAVESIVLCLPGSDASLSCRYASTFQRACGRLRLHVTGQQQFWMFWKLLAKLQILRIYFVHKVDKYMETSN